MPLGSPSVFADVGFEDAILCFRKVHIYHECKGLN